MAASWADNTIAGSIKPEFKGFEVLPVLNEGDHLRVRLPKNALPVHLHQPIPCRTETDHHNLNDHFFSNNRWKKLTARADTLISLRDRGYRSKQEIHKWKSSFFCCLYWTKQSACRQNMENMMCNYPGGIKTSTLIDIQVSEAWICCSKAQDSKSLCRNLHFFSLSGHFI